MLSNFRPGRFVIVASATAFVLLLLLVLNHLSNEPVIRLPDLPESIKNPGAAFKSQPKSSGESLLHAPPGAAAAAVTAAGNATLGFHKILWINMKRRWDKSDASRLQAYVSGLNIETVTAVDGKEEIDDAGRVGLPPFNGRHLKGGEIACYRSHANIWSDMVETRSPPILIMESDAAWDVNLRAIMSLANQHFVEYLAEIGSKPRNAPFYEVEAANEWPSRPPDHDNPDDPWLSEHWDILSIGHCNDQPPWLDTEKHPSKGYKDKWASTRGRFDMLPGANRVIKRSKGFACTTAYAVSHRGAAKMLHRHALELNEPIDLIMLGMINSGDLISYTINPPPVAQWEYMEHLGLGSGANSDIHTDKKDPEGKEKGKEKEDDKSGWDVVHKKHAVWAMSDKFPDLKFKEPALEVAYNRIFKQAAPFQMPEVPGLDRMKAAAQAPSQVTEETEEVTTKSKEETER